VCPVIVDDAGLAILAERHGKFPLHDRPRQKDRDPFLQNVVL
jgi:hypothetical protein